MNRIEKIRSIRNTLKNGKVSIGSWMQIPNGSVAEILGKSGYDWVAVDMEHGSISTHQLPDIFRSLELGGTLPLVRLSNGSEQECKKVLDAGAGGVVVPMVENAEQLIDVRDACRWPPAGKRGVAFSRANLFGKNFDQYIEEAQSPILVAMIESINAVNNLDEILQVDGLDAILIGPYDLSASMGTTAEFNGIEFQKTIEKIKEKADRKKIACGIHVVEPSVSDLNEKIDNGYRLIAYSIDAVFLHHISQNPLKN